MMTEDRPTNGERYASAIDSSDLKVRESGGDVDTIIAAGLVDDGLATSLYRLVVEFDAQRGPLDAARRWASEQMAQSHALREEARCEELRKDAKQGHAARLSRMAEEVKDAALLTLRTEFVLALAAMKTLREARAKLWVFAHELATRRRFDLDDEAVEALTWRTLDAFLDPNCPHCDGRGSLGGGRHEFSGPLLLCKPCKGLGSRRVEIGRSQTERQFAGALMMAMDAQMYEVQKAIGRNRRLVTAAKELIARAQA